MRVSTPEGTALDLVRYAFELGGLSTIASVIAELSERLKARQLVRTASAYELAVVQRLGFILDKLGQQSLSAPLSKWLAQQHPSTVLLRSGMAATSAMFDERWHLKVNEDIELEP